MKYNKVSPENIVQIIIIITILIIISEVSVKFTYNVSKLFDIFIFKFILLLIIVYMLFTHKKPMPLIATLVLLLVLSIQNNMSDISNNITEGYEDYDLSNLHYTNNNCINPNTDLVDSDSKVCAGINKWDNGYSTQGLGNTITGNPSSTSGSQF
jgi:hypothetical protein